MTDKSSLLEFYKSKWYSSAGIDFKIIEPHIHNFKKVDEMVPPGPRFFIVVNFHTYQYEFLGKGQYILTGYDNEMVKREGVHFQTANMHPEDGEFVVKRAYARLSEILQNYPPEEQKDILLQINYRFRHKKGHYVHLIEQVWVISHDAEGRPALVLVHIYQLPMMDPFKVNVLIKKLLPDQTYDVLHHKIYPEPEEEIALSHREKEIIRLLSEGRNSKEIGEKLNISYHTVRTHRKNILHKLEMSSTNELVAYGITSGLISPR